MAACGTCRQQNHPRATKCWHCGAEFRVEFRTEFRPTRPAQQNTRRQEGGSRTNVEVFKLRQRLSERRFRTGTMADALIKAMGDDRRGGKK